jgi:hypothetical protein
LYRRNEGGIPVWPIIRAALSTWDRITHPSNYNREESDMATVDYGRVYGTYVTERQQAQAQQDLADQQDLVYQHQQYTLGVSISPGALSAYTGTIIPWYTTTTIPPWDTYTSTMPWTTSTVGFIDNLATAVCEEPQVPEPKDFGAWLARKYNNKEEG